MWEMVGSPNGRLVLGLVRASAVTVCLAEQICISSCTRFPFDELKRLPRRLYRLPSLFFQAVTRCVPAPPRIFA